MPNVPGKETIPTKEIPLSRREEWRPLKELYMRVKLDFDESRLKLDTTIWLVPTNQHSFRWTMETPNFIKLWNLPDFTLEEN